MNVVKRPDEAKTLAAMQKLYLKTEQRLINEITRKRGLGYVDYAEVAALERVQKILLEMENESFVYVPQLVETIFHGVSEKDAAGYENARVLTSTQIDVSQTLINNLLGEITQASATALKTATTMLAIGRLEADEFREAALKYTAEQQALGSSWRMAQENMAVNLNAKGITAYIDKAGRKWSLTDYCTMATRTTARQASVAANLTRDDYDLWQISKIGSTCPVCAVYEGRVYSKSGTNPDYPPLAAAFGKIDPHGPDNLANTYLNIHPACLHSIMKYTTIGKTEEQIQKDKDFSSFEKNPVTHDPRTKKQIKAYRDKENNRRKLIDTTRQWKKYKAALGKEIPSFETFKEHKDLNDYKYKEWESKFRSFRQQASKQMPEINKELVNAEKQQVELLKKYGDLSGIMLQGSSEELTQWSNLQKITGKSEKELLGEMPKKADKYTIEKANSKMSDVLAANYNGNIERHSLHLLKSEGDNVAAFADFEGISEQSAQSFEKQLGTLISEYETPLNKVTIMNKEEGFFQRTVPASTSHNYEVATAEMQINPVRVKDYDQYIDSVRKSVESGQFPKMKPENFDKYVPTHEFAHSMVTMGDRLPSNARNWAQMNYSNIKKARKEIEALYQDYRKELNELGAEKKELYTKFFNGDESVIPRIKEIEAVEKSVKISKYSLDNVDEFWGEAFADAKLGEKPSKYSKRAEAIANKYFKKAAPKADQLGKKGTSFGGIEPIRNDKETMQEIVSYADAKGINVHDIRKFFGDEKLLKQQIDVLSDVAKEFGYSKKISIGFGNTENDIFAETTPKGMIKFNSYALVNRDLTEDIIKAAEGETLSETSIEGIAAHEFGHLLQKLRKRDKTLEIARKAYYNIGEDLVGDALKDKLIDDVSAYSFAYTNGYGEPTELLAEIIGKHVTNPDAFTAEFVKLFREDMMLWLS